MKNKRYVKYLIVLIILVAGFKSLYSSSMKEYILSQDKRFLYLTDFEGNKLEKCIFPVRLIPRYISGEDGLLCGLGENKKTYLMDWYYIEEYPEIEKINEVLTSIKSYGACCSEDVKEYSISYCEDSKIIRILCSIKSDYYSNGNLLFFFTDKYHIEGRDKINNEFTGMGVESGTTDYNVVLVKSNGKYKIDFGKLDESLAEASYDYPVLDDPKNLSHTPDVFFVGKDIVAIMPDGSLIYYNVPSEKTRTEKLPDNIKEMLKKGKIRSYDCKKGELYFMEKRENLIRIFYVYDLETKNQRKLIIKLPPILKDKYFDITRDGRYVVGEGIIYDLKKRKKLKFPSEYGTPMKFYIRTEKNKKNRRK